MFRKGEEEEIFGSYGETGKMKDGLRDLRKRWPTTVPYVIHSTLRRCKYGINFFKQKVPII